MRSVIDWRWLGVSLLALVGCATEYLYRPAENANATVGGRLAARYAIPPEQPRGEVRVASFGIAELQSEGAPTRTMHVRMIVENNNGRGPWYLDTREQLGIVPEEGQVRPSAASADVGGLPIVRVDPGDARTIDLFYPLPPSAEGASDLPQFDLLWRVQTDTRLVSERVPFDRFRVEPEVVGGGPNASFIGPGYGPYWWYDPLYPSTMFLHRPMVQTSGQQPGFITSPRWR